MTGTEQSPRQRAIGEEQSFVDTAYAALDQQRDTYQERLDRVRAQTGQESAGEMSERDSFATHYEDNLIRLRNVENRLVLGRLDYTDERAPEHIGRIGLKNDAQEIILLDWRAPQSEPFYRATAANPGGVRRRRHIQTRLRTVTGVEDELLDATHANADDELNLTGEGALMAAMNKARDGKMGDIVATIQAEQDRIIRSDAHGILVVQGGPGTGKTAVALHRAAYLLYTLRERLSRSGVLIIGPSPVFLRYIDEVLPSLGESDVVSTTIGGLVPGVRATRTETPALAELKGRLVWRDIARRAVTELLEKPLREQVVFDIGGVTVRLRPRDVQEAQARARRTGRPHNEARDTYAKHLVTILAEQIAHENEVELADNQWIVADVAASVDARREINLHWLPSSAAELLERLYKRPALLAQVAPELTEAERESLYRAPGGGWSDADIAIIDELSEHLGVFDSDIDRRERRSQRAAEAEIDQFTQDAMEGMGLGGGIVTAEMLAERMKDQQHRDSLAERAAADRTWTYGHVVIDEAQELSPMQWEMIIRRNPSRSMTIVGDVDQRPAGAPEGSWKELLGRLSAQVREEHLTISYRTPAPILRAAQRVLAAAGVQVRPVTAARDAEDSLTLVPVAKEGGALARQRAVVETVREACLHMDELYGQDGGTAAVIVASARRTEFAEVLDSAVELAAWRRDTAGVDVTARIQLLDAVDAKGLEYDAVVLVEPQEILEEGPGNLYVAMTRPTQKLRVVYSGELPAGFTD